jgi:hypothetical protein
MYFLSGFRGGSTDGLHGMAVVSHLGDHTIFSTLIFFLSPTQHRDTNVRIPSKNAMGISTDGKSA